MSQTETIMLVALGFVAALLVGLLVVRGLWAYAVSLGKRRVERRAPSHIAELKADRDRLKAEFAMQGRRLQLRLDDLKTRMAEQMAEASRNRNRIEQLAGELGRRDAEISKRDAEIDALKAQADSLERELTQRTEMTQTARDDLRERDELVADLRAQLVAAEARIGEQRQLASATGTDQAGMTAASSAAPDLADTSKLNEAEQRLRKRIDELNALTRQIDEQRRDLSFQHAELNTLREQIDRSRQVDEAGEAGKNNKPAIVDIDEPVVSLTDIETAGNQLEQQIIEAEKETENLTRELAELDDIWNKSMARFEENESVKAATAKVDEVAQTAEKPKKPAAKRTNAAKKAKKTAARKSSAGKTRSKTSRKRSAQAKSAKQKTVPEEPAPNPDEGNKDNVISLAQRIRALQGDLGKNG